MDVALPSRSQYVAEFQEKARALLADEEKAFLLAALSEFKRTKAVQRLMQALETVLSTPEKMDLLRPLRFLIPETFALRAAFDKCAPYHRMANPVTKEELSSMGVARPLLIQRLPHESFGLSIRGGFDMGTGVFVSSVAQESPSDRAGLRVGDEILSANSIAFQGITHARAVEIIKGTTILKLVVRYTGHVPAKYVSRSTFNWVDSTGRAMGTSLPSGMATAKGILDRSEERRVVFDKSAGPLGFSIRGGADFALPVFVSSVDLQSQAEKVGLLAGDEIVSINGEAVDGLFHEDVVQILRSNPTFFLTVKYHGKVPTHRVDYGEMTFRGASVGDDDEGEEGEFDDDDEFADHGNLYDVDNATLNVSGVSVRLALRQAAFSLLGQTIGSLVESAVNQYEDRRITAKQLAEYLLTQLSDPEHFHLIRDIRPIVRVEDRTLFNAVVRSAEVAALGDVANTTTRDTSTDSSRHARGQRKKGQAGAKRAQLKRRKSFFNPIVSADWPAYGDPDCDTIEIVKEGGKIGFVFLGGSDTSLTTDIVTICHVHENSPAKEAGLVPGVQLFRIGGESTERLSHAEIRALLAHHWENSSDTTTNGEGESATSSTMTLLVSSSSMYEFDDDALLFAALPLTEEDDQITASTEL